MPNSNLQQHETAYRNIARAIDAAPMTAPEVNGGYSGAAGAPASQVWYGATSRVDRAWSGGAGSR